ncbi:kinase-like domain-containing protein [Infundibulicybe gibba]|nr:kinase-like domain-containing protein [Infundibulicybe gibba]
MSFLLRRYRSNLRPALVATTISHTRIMSKAPIISPYPPTRRHLAGLLASASASSASLQLKEGDVEVVTVEGLRHTNVKLQARHYKLSSFAAQLLDCLQSLHVPSWSNPQITPSDIKVYKNYTPSMSSHPLVSRWIGARMAELHSVDIEVIEETTAETRGEGNVRSWLGFAQDVLAMPAVPADLRKELDLLLFKEEWSKYTHWLSKVDDVQRGIWNLLRLKHPKEGIDEHRQIIVVDFEYAAPNPASFDIANHFHEWTADYHSSTPHLLDPLRYPTKEERHNFYIAYLLHSTIFGEDNATIDPRSREAQITDLDQQVRAWSPASHAMWAIWGIVQAREDVEGNVEEPEFDYLSYSRCRMAAFRREIATLGL